MHFPGGRSSKTAGFTIIEVLIVMLIAGLILAIVFLIVPAAQRNARNVQRRKDVGVILTFFQETILVNNAVWPGSCNTSQSDCFLRDPKLLYYRNQSSENIVSFHNRDTLGPYADPPSLQLDPEDTTSRERVSIRNWARCDDSGLLTGDGAQRGDLAAQFVIETPTGGMLQCIES